MLLGNRGRAVNRLGHGVFGILAKHRIHGREGGPVAVTGHLHALSETPAHIVDEGQRLARVALTDQISTVVSAQIAVHVQASPAFAGAAIAFLTLFCFA
jgi:hypothetical protein